MSRKTIRNLVVALVMFLIVVAATAYMFYDVLKSSQVLEEQIAAVAAQNQQEESLLRLQKLAQSSEGERAELESYFLLLEGDSIGFLREIESLAPGLGVDLETNNLQQISDSGKDWIQFSFSAEGTRQDVQNFIQILEIIPYVSRVTSVSLQGEGSEWLAEVIIQVQLLSYDQ